MTEPMHLTAQIIGGYGIEEAAWRWPGNQLDAFIDVDVFVKAAQVAERGKFDAFFIADTPGITMDISTDAPQTPLEPLLILTAIARETERIGLVATASTTLNEPYTIARQFRALDLISKGRAGWNAVTTQYPTAILNYREDVPSSEERYGRAHEFIATVMALWGSWSEHGLLLDRESGQFADTSEIHPVGIQGQHVVSRGPITMPPSPQGQPIIFQAGPSANGLHLAGRFADASYNNPFDIDAAINHTQNVRQAASAYGRRPERMRVFNGVITSVASTSAEALERREKIDALGSIGSRVAYLGQLIGVPLELSDLDKPIDPDALATARAHPADPRAPRALELARQGHTVRRVLAYGPIAYHPVAVGTPDEVADFLQRWHEAGTGAGFNITPDATDGLEHFVDEVIPVLQKRGLYRTDYEGSTLREHLGIPYHLGLPEAYGEQQ